MIQAEGTNSFKSGGFRRIQVYMLVNMPRGLGLIMCLEHHLVGGYVRYISPYIIIIIKLDNHMHCCTCLVRKSALNAFICTAYGKGLPGKNWSRQPPESRQCP